MAKWDLKRQHFLFWEERKPWRDGVRPLTITKSTVPTWSVCFLPHYGLMPRHGASCPRPTRCICLTDGVAARHIAMHHPFPFHCQQPDAPGVAALFFSLPPVCVHASCLNRPWPVVFSPETKDRSLFQPYPPPKIQTLMVVVARRAITKV